VHEAVGIGIAAKIESVGASGSKDSSTTLMDFPAHAESAMTARPPRRFGLTAGTVARARLPSRDREAVVAGDHGASLAAPHRHEQLHASRQFVGELLGYDAPEVWTGLAHRLDYLGVNSRSRLSPC
jgi:hypothetical protein